jgi:tRNA modification GTPase
MNARPPADSTTRIAWLTSPGLAAIATLAVVGPRAWETVRSLFHGSAPLPAVPRLGRVWHGWLGEHLRDEVTITADLQPESDWIEIHCHGGTEVIRALMEQFASTGIAAVSWHELPLGRGRSPLQVHADFALRFALTLRTADILLWQVHGALDRALTEIRELLERGDLRTAAQRLERLNRHGRLGRHLTEPWRIVIAGAPNSGKSSLMNALAGFQRSIVAPTAGTTRDVVTTLLAFDGWPATAADTAGIRQATDELEQAGIARAEREAERADLCLWLLDGAAAPIWPVSMPRRSITIINKIDQPPAWDWQEAVGALRISARTVEGMEVLTHAVGKSLVPEPPSPGEAVPYTAGLCAAISLACQTLALGRCSETMTLIDRLLSGEFDREIVQSS